MDIYRTAAYQDNENHTTIKMPQTRIEACLSFYNHSFTMFDYKEEKHIYKDALDLKHPESTPVAKEHNLKQSKSTHVACLWNPILTQQNSCH